MRTEFQREKLIDDFTWRCFESVSIEDFSERALPLLDQLLDTSSSLVYRGSETGIPIPLAGTLKQVLPNYSKECFSQDPIRMALQRNRPKLQKVSLLPEWEGYQKTPVYQEFAKPNDIHDFYHIILGGGLFIGPGMVGIMLPRSKKQPEFEEQDGLNLARFLPALDGMIRRDAALQYHTEALPLMEAMVELQSPLALAFSLKGRLLWVSRKAAHFLKLDGKGKQKLPEALLGAVLAFQKIFKGETNKMPIPSEVVFKVRGGEATRAQLRLVRAHSGEPFILSELDPPLYSLHLETMKLRYELTLSETKVLGLMAQGLSNLEISKYLFISMATVHTHVSRILSKLGVSSRVQAALLAHGIPILQEEN